jgi:hypothetical protein
MENGRKGPDRVIRKLVAAATLAEWNSSALFHREKVA